MAVLLIAAALFYGSEEPAQASTAVRVSVFNYPGLNGSVNDDGCDNENSNLLSIIDALPGYEVDGDIKSFGGSKWKDGTKPPYLTTEYFASELQSSQFFFMTDMERENPSDTDFFPVAARTVLREWVASGGVMVMTGTMSTYDHDMLNLTFNWNLQRATASPWTKQTTNTAGTPFDGVSASTLYNPSATDAISNANGSVADFTPMWGTNSNATVAVMRYQSGYVIFLGFDFFDTGAPGVVGVTTYANDGRRRADQSACGNYSASTSLGTRDSIWVSGVLPAALAYATTLSTSSVGDITATSANFTYQINQTGDVWYLVAPATDPAPTAAQVRTTSQYTTAHPSATVALQGSASISANTPKPLALSGLTESTSYVVYAVTEYDDNGTTTLSSVTSASFSTAPTAVTVEATAGVGEVSLALVTTSAVTNFQYSIDEGSNWISRSPASGASPWVVSGLNNGTTYNFQVRGLFGTSPGMPSASVSATPDLLEQAALAVTLSATNAINGDTISVGTTGGSGAGSVTYSVGASTACTISSTVVTVTQSAGTCVVVATKASDGTYRSTSASASIGIGAVPTVVRNLAATQVGRGGVIAVEFDAPSSDGGQAVVRYEFSLDGTSWTTATTTGGSGTPFSFTISGLRYQNYNVYVRAVNDVGEGPDVSVSLGLIPPPPPPIVTVVTTVPASSTSVPVTSSTLPAASTTNVPVNGSAPETVPTGELPEVPPGQSLAFENGVAVPVVVEQVQAPTIAQETVVWRMEGSGFQMDLEVPATSDSAGASASQGGGVVTLVRSRETRVSGTGFSPGTWVDVWLMSTPRFIGSVLVGPDGTFLGELPIPSNVEVGLHTLQANGVTQDGTSRSLNLGVQVLEDRPMTLPITGSDSGPTTLALFAIVLGGLVLAARRRSSLTTR